eukprot:scaffold27711_cov21-Tisochrysis_lutea.AAC.2
MWTHASPPDSSLPLCHPAALPAGQTMVHTPSIVPTATRWRCGSCWLASSPMLAGACCAAHLSPKDPDCCQCASCRCASSPDVLVLVLPRGESREVLSVSLIVD